MQLLQGDAEAFTDVLGLISDYEAVLSRKESLAANLGAKLTGPKLVNAMERLFEGPISITPSDPRNGGAVTWLDIVQFAKASPNEFNLTTTDHGRVCTFWLNGNQVEITEDDWRMIVNGTLDRFNLAPSQPLEEDEDLELATVEILNERLQVLIKKADEVARKARQLNYQISGRKAAISSRRASTLSPAPRHPSSFTAHNQPQRGQSSRSNCTYDLKSDLLRQFATASSSLTRPGSARLDQTSISLPTTPVIQQGQPSGTSTRPTIQPLHVSRGSPAASVEPQPQPPKSASKPDAAAADDDPSSIHRPLITARIEKLTKGDPITPPCDRCRRLRVQCIKHLTACQGCTKKHAKCAWKTITDDEVAALKGGEMPAGPGTGAGLDRESVADNDNASVESRSGGGHTPDPQSAASSASAVDSRTFAATVATAMSNVPGAAPPAHQQQQQQHGTPNGATYAGSYRADSNPPGSAHQQQQHQPLPKKNPFMSEFGGLRDAPPNISHRVPTPGSSHGVDHSRLSHMASVALSAEQREREQQHWEREREQYSSTQPDARGAQGGRVPVE